MRVGVWTSCRGALPIAAMLRGCRGCAVPLIYLGAKPPFTPSLFSR